jgi:hypothetical protein
MTRKVRARRAGQHLDPADQPGNDEMWVARRR